MTLLLQGLHAVALVVIIVFLLVLMRVFLNELKRKDL
jgi:hypothetical protein